MELVKKIMDILKIKPEEKDSAEYHMQSEKCNQIYEEIFNSLNEGQQKKLFNLDSEYFLLSCIWKDEGFEKGFKLSMRLILGCLQD